MTEQSLNPAVAEQNRVDKVVDNSAPNPNSAPWWKTAVIYQIYPRSFADQNGDGIGDLPGITARLPKLAELGIDAIWLSPFFTSPQKDAGYDVSNYTGVDPIFGNLNDFDNLVDRAHQLKIRVIIDMVPNHTSAQHTWFIEALASPEGSPERDRYIFSRGKGEQGELPPNNWQSVFGGPAWSRIQNPDGTAGQWYLHLFDPDQPDLNWRNPWVREQFANVLRFWLDRGVDGFRVDVAHGMIKAKGLPDYTPPQSAGSMGSGLVEPPPYWGQEEVHDIWRQWRTIVDSYPGERILAAEAWLEPLSVMAKWVRSDEFHQCFNFSFLESPWNPKAQREVIDESITEFNRVGAPSTWVLSNHDVVRHPTRLNLKGENPQGSGLGPDNANLIGDPELGLRRARAATLMMLALPGSSYLFQGEELGLPEVIDLPDEARQDPTWLRSNREKYGRDGCRVPIPWDLSSASFGFNSSANSWLPQPEIWANYTRAGQELDPDSTLNLYKSALRLRREFSLASQTLEWLNDYPEQLLAFRVGGLIVLSNFGADELELDQEKILLHSDSKRQKVLGTDSTVWLKV